MVFQVTGGLANLLPTTTALPETDPQLGTYVTADYAELVWPRGLTPDPPAIDLLPEHLPANARVVDLGCGTGGAAARLATHGVFVLGLDTTPQRLRAAHDIRVRGETTTPIARAIGHAEPVTLTRPELVGGDTDFLLADVVDPPLAPNSWDAVVLSNVYDVVRSPTHLLGQARALLRPGGVLFLSSPYQFTARTPHRPADPAADLRARLSPAFTPLAQANRLWVLRDNDRRYFAYLLDVVIARRS